MVSQPKYKQLTEFIAVDYLFILSEAPLTWMFSGAIFFVRSRTWYVITILILIFDTNIMSFSEFGEIYWGNEYRGYM